MMLDGLVQKSGLLDFFHITPGDDLQDDENLGKAALLLGFLTICFDEDNLQQWKTIGERLIRC
jgi:hypothetical protein